MGPSSLSLCPEGLPTPHLFMETKRPGSGLGLRHGPCPGPLAPSHPHPPWVGRSGQLGHPALVRCFEPVLLAPYQALQDYQSHLPLRQLEFRAFELQMSQVPG